MGDYLSLRREVERKVGKKEFRRIMKELGYTLLYYGFGAYLPYSLQKKLLGEKLKKYDPFKSTFINSCVMIGASLPLLSLGDITLSYQTMINWRYVVGFSFTIPAHFFRTLGVYFLITNPLRILYAFIKRKRVGDMLIEWINYTRNEIPRIIAKRFAREYGKKVEEDLKKALLLEKGRKELEEKIRKVREEIEKANEEYFKRKYGGRRAE